MSASKAPHATSRVIIEAIDALRNRKARPDETRISHWIERVSRVVYEPALSL